MAEYFMIAVIVELFAVGALLLSILDELRAIRKDLGR